MAFEKIPLATNAWTLIGNNVSTITFQNAGQQQIYVAVTTTNVAPTYTVGILYDLFQGELKIATSALSNVSGQYVWARPVTGAGSAIVDI